MERIKKAIKLSIKDMVEKKNEYFKTMSDFNKEKYGKDEAERRDKVLYDKIQKEIAEHKSNISVSTPDRELIALRISNMGNYELYHSMLDLNWGDLAGNYFSKDALFEYSIMRFEFDTRLDEAGFFKELTKTA